MTLISPCDSYDCSEIPNSQCFSYDEGPSCSCDSNFDRYDLQTDGSYTLNNTENKFDKESTTLCRSNLPCSTVRKNFSKIIVNLKPTKSHIKRKNTICQEFFKSCGDNEVCSVHDKNGLPTAFCECYSGYHDPNVTDSRLEVFLKQIKSLDLSRRRPILKILSEKS